eukprot:c4963_g1_i1.p1 GENE.c4963_g1_i1~~c4963_g1_i1.p1  ORF type:complete len:194 (+),score=44.90 c4963_g1_i1:198-779(+)
MHMHIRHTRTLSPHTFSNHQQVLNFAIAYGMTLQGLEKTLGVTNSEAADVVNRWYGSRPEVKQWQEKTLKFAEQHGHVHTLLGRRRILTDINSDVKHHKAHHERAAINTPIQGGAADVVMCAMLNLEFHPRLKELGWKMLLQIHDEVILEGPEESAEEALAILIAVMTSPFPRPSPVEYVVDAHIVSNWAQAK